MVALSLVVTPQADGSGAHLRAGWKAGMQAGGGSVGAKAGTGIATATLLTCTGYDTPPRNYSIV